MSDLDDWLAEPGERFAKAAKKPKGKWKPGPELVFQISVKKLLRQIIADAGVLSLHGVCWFAIEYTARGKMIEGRNGKPVNIERVRNKSKGVVTGVPDICLIYLGRYHGIELKAGKNDLEDSQKALHPVLRGAGAKVGVVWTLEELVKLLGDWGIPMRKVTF